MVYTAVSFFIILFSVLFLEQKGNNHYGYCQAGISAQFTVDGEDVIMGTVGVRRWKGTVYVTNKEALTVLCSVVKYTGSEV